MCMRDNFAAADLRIGKQSPAEYWMCQKIGKCIFPDSKSVREGKIQVAVTRQQAGVEEDRCGQAYRDDRQDNK